MKTNHVNQVAAFEQLLGYCNVHGSVFNPSKSSIKMPALQELLQNAQHSLAALKVARTAYDNAVIARLQAYRELPRVATRIINALSATDASKEVIQKANAFRQSLSSRASRPALPSQQPATAEQPRTRSTSMLSFTRRVDNFAALVQVLSAEPEYTPNEESMQVPALIQHVAFLREKNKGVYDAQVALSNARFARNKYLYGENGIHECGLTVKKYMKSVFGPASVPYRQIAGLPFRDNKF
jgi:hypothetical protein